METGVVAGEVQRFCKHFSFVMMLANLILIILIEFPYFPYIPVHVWLWFNFQRDRQKQYFINVRKLFIFK
jgi:hypothetical protein